MLNTTTTTSVEEKAKAERVVNQEKQLEDEDFATDDKNTTKELEDIQHAWNNATVTLKFGVKFLIIDGIPHDPDAFTQGLTSMENYLSLKDSMAVPVIGWGITYDYDRDRLIVTDGSSNLIFWDPDCWQPEKQSHCALKSDPLPVIRQNGQPAMELNEIEYWRGRVLANFWLLVINPETGQVEKEYGTGCCEEDESNGTFQLHSDCNVSLVNSSFGTTK